MEIPCLRPDKLPFDTEEEARQCADWATDYYKTLITYYVCGDHWHIARENKDYVAKYRMELTDDGGVLIY